MSGDDVQYWSGVATIVALFVGIGALLYAGAQLGLARKAGSGASLIALSEAFRQNWNVYLNAKTPAERLHAFADLANCLEIACAVFRDKVFYGQSEDVLRAYLINVFALIEVNPLACQSLVNLLEIKETFDNITDFTTRHRPIIARASARIREEEAAALKNPPA
jgi:hypothetical protein